MKILLLRYSQNSYQIWLYKLNLNISAVNQAVFCYYQKFSKIIIEKKTLVLVVSSNEGMHFFELI